MLMKKLRFLFISIILCPFCISCAGPDISLKQDTIYDQPITNLQRDYTLGAGDVIKIEFYDHQSMDRQLIILPDGKISLPFKGDLVAAGLTPNELKEKITALFSDIYKEPIVTVTVVEYMKNNVVYVMGEVKNPNYYFMETPTTLTQILARSGGFLETARLDTVLVISRTDDGHPAGRLVNVSKVMEEANIGHDILLKRYDIVYVPKSSIAKADLFVEQYLSRLIPNFLKLNYTIQD